MYTRKILFAVALFIRFDLVAQNAGDINFQNASGFTENKGQFTDENGKPATGVLFKTSAKGMDVYVTEKGISYSFFREDMKEKKYNFYRMDLVLSGASIKKENVVAEVPNAGVKNYFYAHCPNGIYGVKTFNKITVKNVYPGIDWVLKASPPTPLQRRGENETHSLPGGEGWGRAGMEYDFIVHPGADPNNIRLIYEGAEKISLNENGLRVQTPFGEISEKNPVSFQEGKEIETKYIFNNNFLTFQPSNFSTSKLLTIDPPQQWSTFYGGSNGEIFSDVITDAAGNMYLTGEADSPNLPFTNSTGAYNQAYTASNDIVIAKFNSSGVAQWVTYYGGSGVDDGHGIAVDASQSVFVTGTTTSPDLPLQSMGGAYNQPVFAGGKDIFILKFNNACVRQWATYYGGSKGDSMDIYKSPIAVDLLGNVYITGETASSDFPLKNLSGSYNQSSISGIGDAFILKFSNAGVHVWATYYGGSATEDGSAVCTDAFGNVFVTGSTYSTDFPLKNSAGAYNQGANAGSGDGYILKFDAAGVQQWATYFGGGAQDLSWDICSDVYCNIYIVGRTWGGVPVVNLAGAYSFGGSGGNFEGFYAKFNSTGACVWSDNYGGNNWDEFIDAATDNCGNFFISGRTQSSNFPTYNPGGSSYYDLTLNNISGFFDICLLAFNANGVRTWGTYYGGNGNDGVRGMTCDPSRNLYIVGDVDGTTFPLKTFGSAYQQNSNANSNNYDAMIARFGSSACATVTATPCTAMFASCSVTNILCNGSSTGSAAVTASNGTAPYSYSWSTGSTAQIISNLAIGTYTVIVTDVNGTTVKTSGVVTQGSAPNVLLSGNTIFCSSVCNGSVTATGSGGTTPYSFSWSNSTTGNKLTGLCVGGYTVTITDANGCSNKGSVSWGAPASPTLTVSSNAVTCFGGNNGSAIATISSAGTFTYKWSNSDSKFQISNLLTGIYSVTVTNNNGCSVTGSVNINQPSPLTLAVSGSTVCAGQTGSANASVFAGTSPYNYLWSNGFTSSSVLSLPAGVYSVTVIDNNGCTITGAANIIALSTPTIAITADTTITLGQSLVLNASGGTNYTWNTTTELSCLNCSSPIASPQSNTAYCVTVSNSTGCSASACVNVSVEIKCEELFIPNAFSPNGDNENDALCFYGSNCIRVFHIAIYNRWGGKVFESADISQCWNAVVNEKESDGGIFVYTAEAIFTNGERMTKQGNITLIR